MRKILDLAEGLDAKREAVTYLVLELPIILKLQAIFRRLIPDLSDEKGIQSRAVTTHGVSREGTEEDFVRGIGHRLINSAKGKRETVSLRFDELVLTTDLEFLELQTLANWLLEKPLDDQLRPFRQTSLELDLMALTEVFVLTRPGVNRSVLFDLGFALLHIGLTHIELGGC